MQITYPSILVMALVLASCGGGGGDSGSGTPTQAATTSLTTNTPTSPTTSPPTTTTPTPTQNNTPRIIDYYGDSTVYGYATGSADGHQVATPAPKAFADELPASPSYQVRNEGVSGTTACQLLNGQDGVHPQWSTQMTSSNATHVIVNHAINDQGKEDLALYKSCLTSLAVIAKQNGKQIIFETPNPIVSSSLDTYVAAMKEVASQQNAPVIDEYQYLKDYLQGRNPSEIVPDGLHPTDSVYVMKGRFAAQEFQKKCGNFTCAAN